MRQHQTSGKKTIIFQLSGSVNRFKDSAREFANKHIDNFTGKDVAIHDA
jgi:hypothetical protein